MPNCTGLGNNYSFNNRSNNIKTVSNLVEGSSTQWRPQSLMFHEFACCRVTNEWLNSLPWKSKTIELKRNKITQQQQKITNWITFVFTSVPISECQVNLQTLCLFYCREDCVSVAFESFELIFKLFAHGMPVFFEWE